MLLVLCFSPEDAFKTVEEEVQRIWMRPALLERVSNCRTPIDASSTFGSAREFRSDEDRYRKSNLKALLNFRCNRPAEGQYVRKVSCTKGEEIR